MLNPRTDITEELLLELVQDLEDAAYDFGHFDTRCAEIDFNNASEKLVRAVKRLFMEAT